MSSPEEEAEQPLLIAAVWVDPAADDADAVFANNREATRSAIVIGFAGLPGRARRGREAGRGLEPVLQAGRSGGLSPDDAGGQLAAQDAVRRRLNCQCRLCCQLSPDDDPVADLDDVAPWHDLRLAVEEPEEGSEQPRAVDLASVQTHASQGRATADDQRVEAQRVAPDTEQGAVLHQVHVVDVTDADAVLGHDLAVDQVTQAHDRTPGSWR